MFEIMPADLKAVNKLFLIKVTVLFSMSWTKGQMANHPKLSQLLSIPIIAESEPKPAVRTVVAPTLPETSLLPPVLFQLHTFKVQEFTCVQEPVAKPRMTRSDKWKLRPVVVRFRAFADALRAAAGPLPEAPELLFVTSYVAMPFSWSKKKQAAMHGKPKLSKPDSDNYLKGAADALFAGDEGIWLMLSDKYWCHESEQRMVVKILWRDPNMPFC